MTVMIAGYWPSYNIPFYPVIYHTAGYELYVHLTELSYQVSARAKMMRRDQGNIVNMESMQEFMRSNGMYLGQFFSQFSYMADHNSFISSLICIACVIFLQFETLRHRFGQSTLRKQGCCFEAGKLWLGAPDGIFGKTLGVQ